MNEVCTPVKTFFVKGIHFEDAHSMAFPRLLSASYALSCDLIVWQWIADYIRILRNIACTLSRHNTVIEILLYTAYLILIWTNIGMIGL